VQGMKLAKVLLCHPIPPVTMGSGEVTGECGERRVGIVPRVEPLLLPPLHLFGHWDVKIRIDTLLELDMDNHTPKIVISRFGSCIHRLPHMVKVRVNPM
jgi:hypothetical protein